MDWDRILKAAGPALRAALVVVVVLAVLFGLDAEVALPGWVWDAYHADDYQAAILVAEMVQRRAIATVLKGILVTVGAGVVLIASRRPR